MSILKLIWLELMHRKSQVLSGLLAITLGIGVIVGIQSVTRVSEIAVAIRLDNLGANILVLPQAASVDDYYTADIDAPTMPEDYVERIVTSALPGVDNLSPKLTRRADIKGRRVVLTGIAPANEIATCFGQLRFNITARCAVFGVVEHDSPPHLSTPTVGHTGLSAILSAI